MVEHTLIKVVSLHLKIIHIHTLTITVVHIFWSTLPSLNGRHRSDLRISIRNLVVTDCLSMMERQQAQLYWALIEERCHLSLSLPLGMLCYYTSTPMAVLYDLDSIWHIQEVWCIEIFTLLVTDATISPNGFLSLPPSSVTFLFLTGEYVHAKKIKRLANHILY